MAYPPTDRAAPCPKCGNADANQALYHADELPCDRDYVFLGEHVHRICGKCGYQWAEKPITPAQPA